LLTSFHLHTLRDNTERPETITIGTNELIGTDPSKLPPALARLMAGQWKQGASAWSECWSRNKFSMGEM
jgi:UDP-N-acetylglucosamine 2-epimerase